MTKKEISQRVIPGSRLFRDYCVGCSTPMRVTLDHLTNAEDTWCERCRPHQGPTRGSVITPRQGYGMRHTN